MRNFRDAYQDAVNELPKYHIDAAKVQDEFHHRKMVAARRRRQIMSAAAVACVFLLCGIGTATAMNYHQSTIKVRNGGFSITSSDIQTEDFFRIAREGGGQSARQSEGGGSNGVAELNIKPDQAMMAADDGETDSSVEVEELPVGDERRYSSIDDFRAMEDIVIAIPDISWLGEEMGWQEVIVSSDARNIMVILEEGDLRFSLNQHDNRDYQSYASSSFFQGEAVNERNFTNDQGLSYTVFDSMKDGQKIATHAAISINGRDLSLDFFGFNGETVEHVLRQLDLSIYFQ